jgi:tRNA nucleotidyltransferase/poly(A) polymerase
MKTPKRLPELDQLTTYLVGGAVRDELLGRPVQDRDWVVVGSSVEQMLELGFQPVGSDFPVFLHPQTKDEYALARTERKRGTGHRGFEVDANPNVTLEEDLSRRDLTINAMAKSVGGALIDPFDGARDLERCHLRHVSSAFVEDPLRVFRVARFAAQLPGFGVVQPTNELMAEIAASGELADLAAERVWQELHKALDAAQPERFFDVLRACGAMQDWLIELDKSAMQFSPGDAIDRFGELPVGEEGVRALSERLKVPRRHKQAALNYQRHALTLREWRSCPAGALVDCLVDLRVVHDFADFDRLTGLMQRHEELDGDGLRMLARGLIAVTADTSLTGPDYGKALRNARIAWLDAHRSR